MSLWLTHPLFLPSLIVGVTIVLWATSLLPEFITALLFFAAAMMAKIAPPEVIFGGFASSAFWLVFSGFVLGIAIRKTGLADRAAQALSAGAHRLPRPRMVASVVLLSYALGVRDALQHGAHRAADADRGGDGPPRGHCRRQPRLVRPRRWRWGSAPFSCQRRFCPPTCRIW